MRLIDADALYERTAEWEAQAGAYIEDLIRTPLDEMTEDEKSKWKRWTAILGERTAFKHDVADAPTIEAEPIKHGYWIDGAICSVCGELATALEARYCENCGAKMDEVEE